MKDRIREYLNENDISVEMLASELNVSEKLLIRYLSDLYIRYYDCYMMEGRMERYLQKKHNLKEYGYEITNTELSEIKYIYRLIENNLNKTDINVMDHYDNHIIPDFYIETLRANGLKVSINNQSRTGSFSDGRDTCDIHIEIPVEFNISNIKLS